MTDILLPLPLVSVVIPCYNKSASIARTISSVKRQSLSNLECIIVDDGSTDNSKEIILDAIKNDRRFHYIYQDNQRVAAARNKGFRQSTGLYLCMLDGDDAIAPLFLELCVRALENDRSMGIAYSGLHYILPDGAQGLSGWPGRFDYNVVLTGGNPLPTCNVARRDVWERTGGQRSRYCESGAGEEDAEMWLRVGALGFNAIQIEPAATLVDIYAELKKVLGREPTRDEIIGTGRINGENYEKAVNSMFVYSWKSGQVSGNPQHVKSKYQSGHPWMTDKRHPFASMAPATEGRQSHAVRQYDEPAVSVIIPCGSDHVQYLVDALDSLEAQQYRKWEAIVVFDTGERNYDALLMAYPFVRPVYTNKVGAGAARNAGAKIARAKLLLFLDADDWLRPITLEKMLIAWNNSQAIIYGDYYGHAFIEPKEAERLKMGERLVSYNAKTQAAVMIHNASNYDCEEAIRQPRLIKPDQFYIWNLICSLVPKVWHDEIGGFDESMASWEDWDYWLRMARAGKCFERITEPLVNYRFYTGNRRESGRQIAESLLQYMRRKYEEIPAMACSGCGGGRPQQQNPVVQAAALAMPLQASGQPAQNVTSADIVWVKVAGNRVGTRPTVGMVTRQQYGYKDSNSPAFKMFLADVRAQPTIYMIVPDPSSARVAELTPQQQPLGEPIRIA